MRRATSSSCGGRLPLVFDIELAKRQTDENPVFYVQMAHARLCGIFRTAGRPPDSVIGTLELAALPAPEESGAAQEALGLFPEIGATREREPHRVTNYLLQQLATAVHGWYHHTRAVGAPDPRSRPGCFWRAPPGGGANGPRASRHHRPRSDVTG